MVVPIKPDVIPDIVNNLGKLKGRTDDSDIVRNGDTYSFVDKRTNMPLAELNTKDNTLALYKTPRDMALRIDSAFISEKTITTFINDSRVPQQPEITQVAVAPMTVTR